MSLRKKILLIVLVLLVVALGVFFSIPRFVDARMNGVAQQPPFKVSDSARALHDRLWIADLHGDTLLWSRDVVHEHAHGHVDLPRLKAAHVSLQVFSTVTKTPRGLNFHRNTGDTDSITLLAIAQRWPPRTWGSLLERARYQAEKLHTAAAESGGALRLIKSRADMEAFLKTEPVSPVPGRGVTAGLLSTEGLHAIEGKLENIDVLFDAGFRMAGLTHFFDNEVGGSAHGVDKGGLTPLGRQVVRRMEDKGMIVDLAHASPKVVSEVLAMARRPVVISHTGVQHTCAGPRNLSDAQIRAIAANGGLIGIGYFGGAVCRLDAASIVAAMKHVATLVGVQHVALGSDFDGATTTAFDTTGIPLITQKLLEQGFSERDVAAIMGGNVQRFLVQALP